MKLKTSNIFSILVFTIANDFQEIEGKSRRDVGTEIDPSLLGSANGHQERGEHSGRSGKQHRTLSPGTAVASRSGRFMFPLYFMSSTIWARSYPAHAYVSTQRNSTRGWERKRAFLLCVSHICVLLSSVHMNVSEV